VHRESGERAIGRSRDSRLRDLEIAGIVADRNRAIAWESGKRPADASMAG
jgi:hypothetical protein